MFLKTTKSGKYEYVQVVEAVREHGKPVHKVRLNLGRKDAIVDSPVWQAIAKKLAVMTGLEAPQPKKKSIVDGLDFSDGIVLNWGYLAYRKLWDSLGLGAEMSVLQAKTKAEFPFADAIFTMVLHHLLNPGSKLSAYEQQVHYASLPSVELHHLYRALDILCEHKETLETNLYAKNYSLLNSEIDVVFYDVTTFAFQSVVADGLRDFGYSKDAKFNEVQVVLGMFIDSEGTPLGYDLFKGDTFDGKTLVAALASIQKRFGINRVIIVADRGINSKANLKAIADAGYGYIVASRLRSMSTKVKKQALDISAFEPLSVDKDSGEVLVSMKRLPYKNIVREKGKTTTTLCEDPIITRSQKRARKDVADRQRLLEKARKMLAIPGSLDGQLKRSGRRFIKTEKDAQSKYSLDQEAIDRDAVWDGYYAIQTSEREMSVDKVLEAHHTLWKIEESFRIMKSALEVRPIYHWTEDRIRGHFVVCFLAFLLERRLEQKLHNNHVEDAAPLRIRDTLNQLVVTKTSINSEVIYLKSEVPALAGQILRTLRLKQPTTLSSDSQWQTWIESL